MDVISKTLYFLAAAPFIFLLVRFRLLQSTTVRIVVLFLHAAILTILTVFLFNKPSWNWANQTGLIQDVSGNHKNREAYQYIRDRFILVDNSFDKELVLNPEGDEEDSTVIAITNRRKLVDFLRLLNNNISKVDLVVGDIGFDLPTESDSVLQQELLKLSAENKLLLSIVPQNKERRSLGLRENVYGSVSEEGAGKLFVSHTIKQDGYFSLPYKLYAYLDGLSTSEPYLRHSLLKETNITSDSRHTISNTFFPDFYLTDEELIKGRRQGNQSLLALDIDSGYEANDHGFYFLSEPLSPSGTAEFVANLAQRKQKQQRNIIFLGTFSSPTEDIHQTIYTDLHGPVILLNILYALHLKRHYVTFPFILILFIGYSLISWVLIHHLLRLNPFSFGQSRFLKKHCRFLVKSYRSVKGRLRALMDNAKKHKAVTLAINTIDFLVEFVLIEMLHLVLLLALVFIVKKTTGQLINGMSLVVYLTIVNALLKFARRYLAPLQALVKPIPEPTTSSKK
ncbi:MAG TPA: hypothetical protein VM884_02510 [Flavisolibacter sp.]|nr:hypothetical protein [Flavisolibacter sp.]